MAELAMNVRQEDNQEETTDCCIVGAGPAGALLALMLARKGLRVTLLEARADFERAFRGDSLHPSVLELLDELGLAERLLRLRHTRLERFMISGPLVPAPLVLADMRRLKTRFPYIAMLPQAQFLECVVGEAQLLGVHLVRRACVDRLLEVDGAICGVYYRTRGDAGDTRHTVRARLTVGADGRFSRVRRLAGLQPRGVAPPIDVLWFALSRRADDPPALGASLHLGRGSMVALFDRGSYWQVGYVIPKGSYRALRAQGLDALCAAVAALLPDLADRVAELRSWEQIAPLVIESDCLRRWYRPGLLLIGDAAHVMSPVGGVGINCAIHDAAAAARILSAPLKAGRLHLRDLRAVQRRRIWPTRLTQVFQALLQRYLITRTLALPPDCGVLPLIVRLGLRLTLLRDTLTGLMTLGLRPARKAEGSATIAPYDSGTL